MLEKYQCRKTVNIFKGERGLSEFSRLNIKHTKHTIVFCDFKEDIKGAHKEPP